jgi:hypothetical protein
MILPPGAGPLPRAGVRPGPVAFRAKGSTALILLARQGECDDIGGPCIAPISDPRARFSPRSPRRSRQWEPGTTIGSEKGRGVSPPVRARRETD